MNNEKLTAQAILSQLFKLLAQNATGTFLVATSDKKTLHAILQDGTLTGCSYAQQHGMAALESLLAIAYGTCRFIEYRLLPVLPHALIDQSPETRETLHKLRSTLHSTAAPDLNLRPTQDGPPTQSPDATTEPEIQALTKYINETAEILETIELVDDWDYFPESVTDISPSPDLPKDDSGGVWSWFRKATRNRANEASSVIEGAHAATTKHKAKRIYRGSVVTDNHAATNDLQQKP